MRMPSFGSRPVSTSQYSRLVLTPAPSGEGHMISAGATVGLRAAGAGLRVVGGFFVCASSELPNDSRTIARNTHSRGPIALFIDTRRHGLTRSSERSAKFDELEEFHARPRVVSESAEHR